MNITPEIKAAIIPPLLAALITATAAARARSITSPTPVEDPLVTRVKSVVNDGEYYMQEDDINFVLKIVGLATNNPALAALRFPLPENSVPAHDPLTVIVFPSKEGGHGYTVNHPYIVVHGLRNNILDRKGRTNAKPYTPNVVLASDEQITDCVATLTDAQFKTIIENDLFAPITGAARELVARQVEANPPPGE